MRFKSIFFTLLLIMSSCVVFAQAKFSNEFLKIGVGARAFGMSSSFTAAADDVTAGYWNPAGLTRMKDNFQFSAMHAEYFAGIAAYDYAAFATKIDEKSVLGFSFLRFGVDDIPNTTQLIDSDGNLDFDRVTFFTAADYAGIISYARKSGIEGLSYGGNVKVIYRQIGDFANAWGFGFDLSGQYQKNKWSFGAIARDVTTTFNAWNFNLDDATEQVFVATGNDVPENAVELTLPELVLGVNRSFVFSNKIGMLAEVDFRNTFDGKRNTLLKSNAISVDPSLGLEFTYNNLIFLRGGVGNFQITTNIEGNRTTTFQPNFGLGVKLPYVSIDYAFTDIGDQSVAVFSNVFSVRIDINKKQ